MSFPHSPREIYAKNPLVEVICQLRFPPILDIVAAEPAEFQNRVRARYPLYQRDEGFTVPPEISSLLGQLPSAPMQRSSEFMTHKFLKEDSTQISLTSDFVAVSVGQNLYDRWEHFREEVLLAQGALEETYRPAFYTRIGLRYRDIIDRDFLGISGEPWHELIEPTFLGVLASPDVRDNVRRCRSDTVIDLAEVPGAEVRIQHGLAETKRRDGSTGLVYQIDADFFTQDKREVPDVTDVLDKFNQLAGYFFRWAIKPKLRNVLEPRGLAD